MAVRRGDGSSSTDLRRGRRQSSVPKKRRDEQTTGQDPLDRTTYPDYVMDHLVAGVALNAFIIRDWSTWANKGEEFDLGPLLRSLEAAVLRPAEGDLSTVEKMLMAQISSLNSLFTALATYANATKHFDQHDRYLRLALKAQNQCRATAETLSVMKNPPIFARQANIAAGPQQVNNTVELARVEKPVQNKLMEESNERLDNGTSCQAISGGPPLEALEPLHRSKNASRQETGCPKRRSRRLAR
jgi:hypothetical protein